MRKFTTRTLTAVCALSALGCKTRDFNSSAKEQSSSNLAQLQINFCGAISGQSPLWTAEQVQQEIQNLINEQGHKSSGLSVYPEVYLAMTRQRDSARCDPKNKMYPTFELNRKLNDALADTMTKGLVAGQRACLFSFANPNTTIPTIGQQLCALNREALDKQWSSFELAMGSTALYLTSIMGLALSSLPHADVLWISTPYQSVQSRVAYMKRDFRPVYDAFNLFLSNNLHTVADVLLKENRIGCTLFKTAAQVVEITRAPTLLFQGIRDKTFELGVELALAWPRGLHPFTAGEATWNVTRTFGVFAKEPEALVGLRAHAQDSVKLFKNPLFKAFKNTDATTYVSGQGLTCPIAPTK